MRNWNLTTGQFFAALAAAVFLFGTVDLTMAIELRLRSETEINKSIVELSDVVDMLGGSASEQRELKRRIAICPSPVLGESLSLSRRDVADRLELHMQGFVDVRWGGASRVVVRRTGRQGGLLRPTQSNVMTLGYTTPIAKTGRSLRGESGLEIEQIEQYVARLIRGYLGQQADSKTNWSISLRLGRPQVQMLEGQQILRIIGGTAPWTGRQTFHLITAQQPVPVIATISRPEWVVKTTRSISRGDTITAGDIERAEQADKGRPVKRAFYTSVDEIVGMQAVSSLKAGQTVAKRDVKPPVYVNRGEVDLVVRVGAIELREKATARKAGRLGELIDVQVLRDGKRVLLTAKVTGPQLVEIFASSTSVKAVPSQRIKVRPPANKEPLQQATPRFNLGQTKVDRVSMQPEKWKTTTAQWRPTR